MTTKADNIVCSTCGAPFHGLTRCDPDAPKFVAARATAQAKMDLHLREIRDCGKWIEKNIANLAAPVWVAMNGETRGTLLMELRHDFEAALRAVEALEKMEG